MDREPAKTIICDLLSMILLTALPATVCARDVHSILARELVEESEQRYVHRQINRCRMQLPESSGFGSPDPVIVERHIEAPADLMSRDRFVAISTAFSIKNRVAFAHLLAPGIAPADAFTAVNCQALDGYDGRIDFHIAVLMDESGIRVETTDRDSGKSAVDLVSWEDMLNLNSTSPIGSE